MKLVVRVIDFIVLYVVSTTGLSCFVFFQNFKSLSWLVVLLSFFLSLNILICVWEISLGININYIKKDHDYLNSKYEKKIDAAVAYMTEPLSFSKLLSLQFWSKIWSK